jgi:hypothetical protein
LYAYLFSLILLILRKDKTLQREMDNQQSALRSNMKMGDINIQSNNLEQEKHSKKIKDIDAGNGQEGAKKMKKRCIHNWS